MLGAAPSVAHTANGLSVVFASHLAINGATTTPSGRLFAVVQPGKAGDPQVIEILDGKAVAYPNAEWNAWKPDTSSHDHFVGVNSIRIGPDGALWAVDRGSTGIGKPLVPGGAKLVKIDVATNKLMRIYDMSSMIGSKSFVDDVRFNGQHAYFTDAGQPGIIIVDLASGQGRRVLEGHPSTAAQSPLIAEGKELRDLNGNPVVVHADQMEVSPDGKWFYYQPSSGSMSRIETRYLDDPKLAASDVASHVEHFADTPSTGGTAIDAEGTIYLSDVDKLRILKIAPNGRVSTLISDPKLTWVDAMWIDDHGNLLLPAAQLNRGSGLNNGVDAVQQPISLYRLPLHTRPSRH
jgi:hypothetical protein